ncbi:hypothetical protein MTO96_043782, partial [Rhipicephalus appendiculatus]
ILQRLEKSADELAKANEALHAEMTDDEVLADMDSVLEYEDRTAGSVGILWHRIEELAVRTSRPSSSNALQAGRDLPKASRIRDLHPFLDEEDGLLQIQTRLRNVVYHEGIKHPNLLPGDHIAIELIATGLHRRLLHAVLPTTVAELLERFWVTKAK